MKKKIIILITAVLAILALVLFYLPTKAAVGRLMYSLRWTDGLVGYWSFDGKDMNWATGRVSDLSGWGNTGVVSGMATSTAPVPGIVGQALYFDGSNDVVLVPDSASLDLTTKLTIETWVKFRQPAASAWAILLAKGGFYNGYGIGQGFGAQAGRLLCMHEGGFAYTEVSFTPNLGQWYHYVCTFDSSLASNNVKIYVDGKLIGAGTETTAVTTNALQLMIGSELVFSSYTDGTFDEARIYNRALSDNEIKYHYDRTAPQFRSQINRSFKDEWKDGLVGYWTMDGQNINWATGRVSDLSGQGNTGVVSGMATSTAPVPGIVGQALSFDGASNYITTPSNTNFNFGAGNFTVSFWIYPTASAQRGSIFASGSSVTAYTFWIDYNYQGTRNINIWASSNGSSWDLINADPGGNGIGAKSLTPNAWNYVVAVRNGNNWNTYINNAQDINLNVPGTIYSITSTHEIGRQGSYGYYLRGSLDDVRIYNRALSAAEILEHYQKMAPAYRPQVNMSQKDKWKSGLVGYWTMDGQDVNWATGKVTDQSGNSNTGQITGMATSTAPVPGIVGQALSFDGADDGVSKLNFQGLDGTAITVLAWVKPAAEGSQRTVSGAMQSTTLEIWSFGLGWGYPNQFGLWFYTTAWASVYPSSTVITGNDWYLAGFTYDSAGGANNLKLYVNGVLEKTGTQTGNFSVTNLNVSAGHSYPHAPTYFFNGLIDEVRVYNRALSAAEILEMYKSNRR